MQLNKPGMKLKVESLLRQNKISKQVRAEIYEWKHPAHT